MRERSPEYLIARASGHQPYRAWRESREVRRQVDRLAVGITKCVGALAVPRRLGEDASQRDLADDKRLARKYANILIANRERWDPEAPLIGADADPAVLAEGSRIDWVEWEEDWLADLEQQAGRLAATGLAKKVDARRVASMVHLLDSEAWAVRRVREKVVTRTRRLAGVS